MKNLLSVLITLFISLNISANDYIVRSQVSDNEVSTEVITVYYFHASNRCKTCIALENETQKALKSLYSKKDLDKALEEGYALGFKHGKKGSNPSLALSSALSSELQLTALNKSLSENSKKINKDLLNKHRDIVTKQMKEWSKDAETTLDTIIEESKKHSKR